jgi:hypothetical protein
MLVVDFLLKHDFNLDKVEDNLWNLASLIDQKEFLSSKEKQKMYEEARAPVRALKEEIHDVKTQIRSTKDKSVSHLLEQKLLELKRKEQEAKVNASNDLFERINTIRMNREMEFDDNIVISNSFNSYSLNRKINGRGCSRIKEYGMYFVFLAIIGTAIGFIGLYISQTFQVFFLISGLCLKLDRLDLLCLVFQHAQILRNVLQHRLE